MKSIITITVPVNTLKKLSFNNINEGIPGLTDL